MTGAELEALAERVEREGPSRDMDAAIARAIGWRQHPMVEGFAVAPSWTTSLDAAVTLVPDGWWWLVGTMDCRSKGCAEIYRDAPGNERWWCYAKTPAAALTAAALRARAQEARND